MKIYKYVLKPIREQKISMPVDSLIMTAQAQGNDLCVWAEVDDKETRMEDRDIMVYGTGEPIEEVDGAADMYINSAQINGLVLHVYERIKLRD